jgi:hypothetical protein
MSEENSNQEESLYIINDVDELAQAITQWHERQVAMLKHMQNVPVGSEVELGDVGGKLTKHIIKGKFREGFIAGIEVALSALGVLPFATQAVEPEQAQTKQDEPTDPTTQH